MDSIIKKNIEAIRKKIKLAAKKSGQNEQDIKLIAVTKNVPISNILAAIGAGITDIGENKAQEILKKHNQLKDIRNISWHFVGHLQRNKVKQIIDFVDLIQSVDSLRLVEEINRRALEKGKVQDILVQVNVVEEEAKFGLKEEDVANFLLQLANFDHVRAKGLMNIAPLFKDPEDARPGFREMKMLFDELKKARIPGIELEYLSMGMTNDFEVAIESGANMVRIGTGIFSSV